MRNPFFGLLNRRSSLDGLIEHYELIAKGMSLIEQSMGSFINEEGADASCDQNQDEIVEAVAEVEDHADKVKRNIRNHMPRGLSTPVDSVLFFNYTRMQDDILDAGQDSLYWLSMRSLTIPVEFQRKLTEYVGMVGQTIRLLKPALEATVNLISGHVLDREEVKGHYRAVRINHKEVNKVQNEIVPILFNSGKDFKEIYQLIHFVERLQHMSHSAEGCADILRAMIAR
jgi:predicted phosphate transport protein (TIGR00153 family)